MNALTAAINKNINDKLGVIETDIHNEVIRLANKVLNHNPKTIEFVMAMGTFFFTAKRGKEKVILDFEDITKLKFGKDLTNFILLWDKQFSVTGDAMRFTKDSEITTDW